MKKIRALQFLVYLAFGLLIVHDVLPDAVRGFKDGWKDGAAESHNEKINQQTISATITANGIAGVNGGDLKINDTYTLKNIQIGTDVQITGDTDTMSWIGALHVALVFAITVLLLLTAYNINMMIVLIANGDVFDAACIRHIRRTGMFLLAYSIADVLWQRLCYTQLQQVIHTPLQVVNTVSFNFEALICGILALIIAEAFKQGNQLKQEQELTI